MSDEFNIIRRNAEITSIEFADYIGMSRQYALKIETGSAIATTGELECLINMIAEKTKAR